METKIKIRFGDGFAEYSIDHGEWYPLPWGTTVIKEMAKVIGHLYQSRGGCWYWRLPGRAIIGYGRYNPTANFYFQGKIIVKNDKFLEERNESGQIIRSFSGMRIGDRKVILFDGKIIPSELFRIETFVGKYLSPNFVYSAKQYCLDDEVGNFYRQGHLVIYPLFIREDWDNLSQFLSQKIDKMIENGKSQNNWDFEYANRRKIFNHQFFGRLRIYWLGDSYWAIRVFRGGEVKVVSPDHLEEPIVLWADGRDAWYIAEHNLPIGNNAD
jgi:hypothetical protein